MIQLMVCVNQNWQPALLSGEKFDRDIIVVLPPDCAALLGRSGRIHMRLNKSAYGLADAPLLWWTEADRRLRAIPLRRHPLDKCAYMCYNKEGVLKGLVTLHVDDMMIGGDHRDRDFSDALERIKKSFDCGKWAVLDVRNPMVFCGGPAHQHRQEQAHR